MKKITIALFCFILCSSVISSALASSVTDTSPLPALPKVVMLATGGTIASAGGSALQLTDYKVAYGVDQMVHSVPGLKDIADLRGEQVANILSENMSIEVWFALAHRANELLAQEDVDGIVVVHGTDTLEETAYFLNLTVKSEKPVVVVGAMRPGTAVSADGPLNLLEAVMVAGSVEARGKGVLIVLNNEINTAREGTKSNTTEVETFRSYDLGLLGYVSLGQPVFYRQSTRKHTHSSEFDLIGIKSLPRVDIVYVYADMGVDVLKAALAAKPQGLVIAFAGNGSVPDVMKPVIKEAVASGITIVRSSRVGTGIVTQGEFERELGTIAADNLIPQKARVLLMLGLSKTSKPEELQRMFTTY